MIRHSARLRKENKARSNDYTRMKMREAGFLRRITPPIQISNDDLDRAMPDCPATILAVDPSAQVGNPMGHAMTMLGVEGDSIVVQNSWSLDHTGMMTIGPYELESV